ncbi:PAS domain-containing protein [Desertivirga brevis]|uniref:PAS domain-containing protein n=1 Tax=Desertivirga brevis TaxID=2810310 RepID=UPI001A97136C
MLTLLDAEGNYLFTGPSSFKILGYRPEDLLGKSGLDLIHPEDYPRIRQLWEGFKEKKAGKVIDYPIRTASGEWIWLEIVAAIILITRILERLS